MRLLDVFASPVCLVILFGWLAILELSWLLCVAAARGDRRQEAVRHQRPTARTDRWADVT